MSSELSDLLSALEDSHDRGDWITARELAEQIISIDPESTEARVYLRIASRKIDENQSIDERDTERKSNHSEDTAKIEGPQDLEVEHSTERTAGLFVGRKRENERLIAAFEEVVAGHGRLVMLAGEPGIGKTRIAEKLAAHAESRGARVLWGRLHEGSGAPPYWPWVQIIRTFVDGGDWQKGQSDLDRYIRVIARVVPELAEEIGELF